MLFPQSIDFIFDTIVYITMNHLIYSYTELFVRMFVMWTGCKQLSCLGVLWFDVWCGSQHMHACRHTEQYSNEGKSVHHMTLFINKQHRKCRCCPNRHREHACEAGMANTTDGMEWWYQWKALPVLMCSLTKVDDRIFQFFFDIVTFNMLHICFRTLHPSSHIAYKLICL